jgi:L-alanine-DL-glutamate epimerase-like enolase superfamily enzyme
MRITQVEAIVLANPDVDPLACDSAQDAVVVRIHTDEGITGVGEVDATPTVVRAFLEAPSAHAFSLGMRDLLLGEDPRDTRRLWRKLYEGTLRAARRGMGVHAIGAVDLALWDIRGKAVGEPIWKLLGGSARPYVSPYASILPAGAQDEAILADAERRMTQARDEGFRAAKIEAVPQVARDEADIVELVRRGREILGPELTLCVDVGYWWRDAKAALRVIRELEKYDPFFIETPLHVDNLRGYAELSAMTPVRIALGELNAGRLEFIEIMDVGRVDVVQPDVPRAGGLTECLRIAELAEDRGRLVIPHAWNTGITAAAAIHLSAVSPNCPFVEYLPPTHYESGLRRDLLAGEPALVGGVIPLPEAPGLGVELDLGAVEHYKVGSFAAR